MYRFGLDFIGKCDGYKYKRHEAIDAKTHSEAVKVLLHRAWAELEDMDIKNRFSKITIKVVRYSNQA